MSPKIGSAGPMGTLASHWPVEALVARLRTAWRGEQRVSILFARPRGEGGARDFQEWSTAVQATDLPIQSSSNNIFVTEPVRNGLYVDA